MSAFTWQVLEGLELGYVAFGIGGALGERRRTYTEFSLAAKVTRATYTAPDGQQCIGYAGKLGDFGLLSGSWADYVPAQHEALAKPKAIVSEETDGQAMYDSANSIPSVYSQLAADIYPALASRHLPLRTPFACALRFNKFVAYASAGDAKHDREAKGEYPPPLLTREDALALVATLHRIGGSDGFSSYPEIRTKLLGFASKVEAAAGALPK